MVPSILNKGQVLPLLLSMPWMTFSPKNSMKIVPKVRQWFFVSKESFRKMNVPCGGSEPSGSVP